MSSSTTDLSKRIEKAFPGFHEAFAEMARPTAGDLAAVLGIKPGFIAPSEDRRVIVLAEGVIKRLNTESLLYRCQVMSHFCLFFLPDLMELVMNPPPWTDDDGTVSSTTTSTYRLTNAAMCLFGWIVHSPYLAKFLESSHPEAVECTKGLPTYLARLVLMAMEDTRRDLSVDSSPSSLQKAKTKIRMHVEKLYCVTVLLFGRPDCAIPRSLRTRLCDQLFQWVVRYPSATNDRPFDDDQALLLLEVLSDKPHLDEVWEMQDELRGYLKCGKPDCNATEDLYICGKCRTVAYCSRAHQRAHWHDRDMPHKELCFKTFY